MPLIFFALSAFALQFGHSHQVSIEAPMELVADHHGSDFPMDGEDDNSFGDEEEEESFLFHPELVRAPSSVAFKNPNYRCKKDRNYISKINWPPERSFP